jgi:hypothetical protein
MSDLCFRITDATAATGGAATVQLPTMMVNHAVP